MKGIVEPDKEILFYDLVEFVKSFCCLGYRLNGSGKSEAAIAKMKIGYLKFRSVGSCSMGQDVCLRQKKRFIKSCVRSPML